MKPDVTVLTTGGTIDKVYFDAKSTFEVGDSVVRELLRQAHVEASFEVVEVMRKDSLEITDQDRVIITQAVDQCASQAVVITHGTDTMADTANALSGAHLEDKTVVLTGALSPARFAQSDATFNVGMAFAAAQCMPVGVYIVMNGQVFQAGRVVKDTANNKFVRC
ncbi:MAG: asparaginase domain-containing protein [Pseudomonadota bacterium]